MNFTKYTKLYFIFSLICIFNCCQKTTEKKQNKQIQNFVSVAQKANENYQNNYKTENVYGNVKTIICSNFELFVPESELDIKVIRKNLKFDKKGNLVEKTVFLLNGKLDYKDIYYYDKMGNVIKTDSYNKFNTLNYSFEEYLNKDGLPFLERYTNPNDSEMCSQYTNKYEFITDSLIIYNVYAKPKDMLHGLKIKKHYSDGNLILKTEIKNKKLIKETKYQYDTRHNKINEIERDADGICSILENKFDKNNNLIHTVFDYKVTSTIIEEKMSYDKFRNITTREYFENGSVHTKYSYHDKFEYDKMNNWTKKERYKLNGERVYILERKINYY